MSPALWGVFCFVSFCGGALILLFVTPRLLKYAFDDPFFIGLAAAIIIGGVLLFAPVGIIYAISNGSPGARFVDILLLALIGGIAVLVGRRCVWPPVSAVVNQVTGILAGSYCALLVLVALYLLAMIVVS